MNSFSRALKVLEFDKILAMLADCCPTEGAKNMAFTLLPTSDKDEIIKRQTRTGDAKRLITIKAMPSFGNVKDVRAATERASKSAVLTTRELLDVAAVLRTARTLIDYINADNGFETSLDVIFGRLTPNRFLEDSITRSILAEDMIADEASPELADVRRKIRNVGNKIREILQRYMTTNSDSKYLQENIVTTRGGRYVVPVKAEYRGEVKGLIHDTSSSGATLFVEPMAVVEANNELRALESREAHEIERILADLSAKVSDSENAINLNYLNITELAFIFGCGELSCRMNASQPKITDKRAIELIRARHPLLDKKTVVPVTIKIGDRYKMIVVTGPNTGGKTVTLKTIGLFTLMAQAGLHITTDGDSSVCVFDSVYADIGDEQSIEQSLSTFSAHMVSIVSILDNMTSDSLILFDELGAGTDPVEGAALAMSILDTVRVRGAICAATTHYAELKAYAIETDGVSNASCEFDVTTLKPTYRLIIGAPGKSNAFAISERLGLAPEIVQAAKDLVDTGSRNFESVIEKLDATRSELEHERDEARRLKAEFEEYKKKTQAEIEKRLGSAEREAEQMRTKAKQLLDGARATSDFVFDQLDEVKKQQKAENFERKLSEAKRSVKQSMRSFDDVVDPIKREESSDSYQPDRPLVKGDVVRHMNLGAKATVVEAPDKNGNVTILMGSVKMRANSADLKILNVDTEAEAKTAAKNQGRAAVSRAFKPELDLRGSTVEDGLFMVDKYLDEAAFAGIKTVTVIHGKGTGALRAAIWTELKKDKRVDKYRPGAYGEGDYGVTVISLK